MTPDKQRSFRTERVFFTVVGQGSIDIQYLDGVETPEQAFRGAFPETDRGLARLLGAVRDFEHIVTCATEPRPGDDCPDCEGTGMVMADDREVTCGTCGGAKVLGGPALDEIAPF